MKEYPVRASHGQLRRQVAIIYQRYKRVLLRVWETRTVFGLSLLLKKNGLDEIWDLFGEIDVSSAIKGPLIPCKLCKGEKWVLKNRENEKESCLNSCIFEVSHILYGE